MSMADSELSDYLNNYVCKASDVIYFKLVGNEKDLEEDIKRNSFDPEFTHQLFGETETIFGYKDLKVKLFYTASSLKRFVSISYSDQVTPEKVEGVVVDDVLKIITDKVGGHFLSNLDQFSALLPKEKSFRPHGTLLNSFSLAYKSDLSNGSEEKIERHFVVYKAGMEIEGFREYHENLQSFLLWFIDAASYIDVDDDHWDYFTMYEKCSDTSIMSNGHLNDPTVYRFVGYMTVYRYYAYLAKERPRISQVLILPPFQRKGLGVKMIQTMYNYYTMIQEVLDITVEDPAENFVRLRDFVDTKNCSRLLSFQSDKIMSGWNEEMAKEAQTKLKVNRKQSRRIYEILKLKNINSTDKERMKEYRLEVKKRLNAPFIKMRKLGLSPGAPGTSAGDENAVKEMRYEELTAMYNQLEEDYKKTIKRISEQSEQ